MKINSKFFGEIKINEDNIVDFPQGLPGFPDEKKFTLLDIEDNPAFQVLQSTTSSQAAFIVANPYLFREEYAFDLDKNILDTLRIISDKEVAVYVILSIKDPFEQSTMNLQAPIIMNQTKQLAKQYILNDSNYSIRTPIMAQTPVKGEK
ncbi:flagellar assembly protein FliW [Sediminibacillus massiliensis]|uniref:flagellar assembly protein FliW n=1 Tax=Sediminibacillus massiliensis TaxID=1926277 RepID=UPI0009883EF3|nr:flagellar assembly protein FliW [Sediminibacillus massiliensis]